MKHKQQYSIKLSITLMFSRQQYLYLILQVSHFLSSFLYFHLILLISSARLLTRSHHELVRNIVLSINCNLEEMTFVISCKFFTSSFNFFFLLKLKRSCIFSILRNSLFFQFFCWLFYDETRVIAWSIVKNYGNLHRCAIF